MVRTLLPALGLAAALLFAPPIGATPEYAARYNQSCGRCHQNPGGAGMRTLYGARFVSFTDLPWTTLEFDEIERIQPMVSDNIQIGADARTLYYSADDGTNSFITMQGDIYLAIQPNDKTMVYFDKGLSRNYEAFILLRGLPGEGFLRAGRFVPTFGWRFADHKTFTRRFLGYGGESGAGGYEDGVEAGFSPEGWDFTLSVTNGAVLNVVDVNRGKAVAARAARRFTLGGMNWTLGGGYRYAELGGVNGPNLRHAGGFWGVNRGRFTLMGESDAILEDNTSIVSTTLLRFRVRQGVYTTATYDYYDPDIDLKTGHYQRVRLAADLVPRGYLALTPAVEWNHSPDREYLIGEVQLHFWF